MHPFNNNMAVCDRSLVPAYGYSCLWSHMEYLVPHNLSITYNTNTNNDDNKCKTPTTEWWYPTIQTNVLDSSKMYCSRSSFKDNDSSGNCGNCTENEPERGIWNWDVD